MPTSGASARRIFSSLGSLGEIILLLLGLGLLGEQQPALAATRDPAFSVWRSAQAAPPPQPAAPSPVQQPAAPPSAPSAQPQAAPATPPAVPAPPPAAAATPHQDDKSKEEKSSVPATVVDGEQLESVLGIEVLSSSGENMGRIVDIIVDRSGQIRAAIIDFGGFLGVGSRKIVVDWRSLQFDPKKAGVVLANLTKDQLRVAPVYKAAEPVVMVGGPGAKP